MCPISWAQSSNRLFPRPDIIRIARIALTDGHELTLGIDDSGTLHAAFDGRLTSSSEVFSLFDILKEATYTQVRPCLGAQRFGRELDLFECGYYVGTCGVLAFAVALTMLAREDPEQDSWFRWRKMT